MEVPRRLRVTADTVRTWRRRFLERDPEGLCDDPRPRNPRKITGADVERVTVKRLRRGRRAPPTGPPDRWRRPPACHSRRSRGSGGPSPLLRTGRRR
ncbi:hypothetical protein [Streptomyces sp. DH8]|uniref:hypothetical protein n=1 Tax=Streptomyces sp. DH8 TaxID=2857008 RepID=UPI001E29E2FC|nr:hypothetical protein [Streptomyces sp. DH8]